MKLSVVTTLYRSAGHVDEFHRRLTEAVRRITDDYEVVFVNDGSPDDSLERVLEIHRRDPHVQVVDLSRNFGHHRAIMTGLEHSRGERVFLIDSDLEEDPAWLERFVAAQAASGADVIYGVQRHRKGGFLERRTGDVFYTAINLLSTTPVPRNDTMARLMTRRFVDNLLRHREREPWLAGLFVLTGFHQESLTIDKGSRGETTYTLRHRLAMAVRAITSFSNRPLTLVFYLGSAIMLLSSLAAGALVVRWLLFSKMLLGWPSLMVSIWFLGGLTIFCIGLLGLYLSTMYVESKQRPYTVVREVFRHAAGEPPESSPSRAELAEAGPRL